MIKMTVIKSKTVDEAKRIFGEEKVALVFKLMEKKDPSLAISDLEDDELKKCFTYLFPDYEI